MYSTNNPPPQCKGDGYIGYIVLCFPVQKKKKLDLLIDILSNYSSKSEKLSFARKVKFNMDNTTFSACQFVCVCVVRVC